MALTIAAPSVAAGTDWMEYVVPESGVAVFKLVGNIAMV